MDSDAASSSPAPGVFSDQVACSSPPSSPPGFPWEKNKSENAMSKPTVPIKSAFSVLGKRKALEAVSENARPAKKAAAPLAAPDTKKHLTQMQISLGQEVQKKCKTCGMEYVPSSTEDRKLHDKYHKQNTEGFDVGKDFVLKTRPPSRLFKGAHAGDAICMLDCHETPARKRRGQVALEVVQRELGAVEIPEKAIWDRRESDPGITCDSNFKAYLYIRGTKCIGYLLAQKITEAHGVTEPRTMGDDLKNTTSSDHQNALAALKARQMAETDKLRHPLELSQSTHRAILGISRIWTSPTHRHQNIASKLLDTAVEHHNSLVEQETQYSLKRQEDEAAGRMSKDVRMVLEASSAKVERIQSKDLIAFSQPTEAGIRLARRWFGKPYGWSVYLD